MAHNCQLPTSAEVLQDLRGWDLESDLGNWHAALDSLERSADHRVQATAQSIRASLQAAAAGLRALMPRSAQSGSWSAQAAQWLSNQPADCIFTTDDMLRGIGVMSPTRSDQMLGASLLHEMGLFKRRQRINGSLYWVWRRG